MMIQEADDNIEATFVHLSDVIKMLVSIRRDVLALFHTLQRSIIDHDPLQPPGQLRPRHCSRSAVAEKVVEILQGADGVNSSRSDRPY